MAGQLYFFKERQKLAFVSGIKNKAGIPAHAPGCSLFFSVTSPRDRHRSEAEMAILLFNTAGVEMVLLIQPQM